jgi:hypothetical protein
MLKRESTFIFHYYALTLFPQILDQARGTTFEPLGIAITNNESERIHEKHAILRAIPIITN